MRKGGERKIKTVTIIQARCRSTRLLNKVLLPILGKPMLWHLIERVKRAKLIGEIVIAVPLQKGEGFRPLSQIATECKVGFFAYNGPVNDLIGRHFQAMKKRHADVMVRIPSDNPCVDPDEIDRIIEAHTNASDTDEYLYSNIQDINGSGYPDGIGAEVYSIALMRRLTHCKDPELREHVHKFYYDKGLVRTIPCHNNIKRPDLRLDVNTQEDFDFVTRIYSALYPVNPDFRTRDIIKYLRGQEKKAEISKEIIPVSKNTLYREDILSDIWRKALK